MVFAAEASAARSGTFRFLATGDAPYRMPEEGVRFKALIRELNRLRPAFAVHVGDIKGGSTPCTDEANRWVLNLFNESVVPFIYTPGDNEWTDCHRKKAGGYDPVERLAAIRKLFFSDPRSLGKHRIPLEHQSANPAFSKFVENVTWSEGGFVFATVHAIGSNNNFQENVPGAVAEFKERNAANLVWMDKVFEKAQLASAKGVVLFMQADPYFEKKDDKRTGFNTMIAAFRAHAAIFKKPILLVHGDSHNLVIDRPLELEDHSWVVPNFMRLEVYGSPDVGAILVTVHPDKPQPFSFDPILF